MSDPKAKPARTTVDLAPAMRKRAAHAAVDEGMSLSAWCAAAIERELESAAALCVRCSRVVDRGTKMNQGDPDGE